MPPPHQNQALRELEGREGDDGARWKEGVARARAAARNVLSRWELVCELDNGSKAASLLEDGGYAEALEARGRLEGTVRDLERLAGREREARGEAEREREELRERVKGLEAELVKSTALASEMGARLKNLPTAEQLASEREESRRYEAGLMGELGEVRRLQRAADAARERAERRLEEAKSQHESLRRENAMLALAVNDREAQVDEYLSLRATVAALNAGLESYQGEVASLEEELRAEREISAALEALVKSQNRQVGAAGVGGLRESAEEERGDGEGQERARMRVAELEGWVASMELELASARLEADAAQRALRECDALSKISGGGGAGGDAATLAACEAIRGLLQGWRGAGDARGEREGEGGVRARRLLTQVRPAHIAPVSRIESAS